MDKNQVRQLFSVLFLVLFIATFVVYFSTDKNMTYTWIVGGAAMVCYLISRFYK